MIEIYSLSRDKDIILIHNPGGWGSTDINNLIYWEKSVVDGVEETLTRLGWDWVMMQFFRNSNHLPSRFSDFFSEASYFLTGRIFRANLLASIIIFLKESRPELQILMLGASQGAAFSNCVMRRLRDKANIFSIELGTFFAQVHRRVISGNTLVIDSNGLTPDPVVHRNLKVATLAYLTAPATWLQLRLVGRPEKFNYCVNVPGHEYLWKYPNVGTQIEKFLTAKFGYKKISDTGKEQQ